MSNALASPQPPVSIEELAEIEFAPWVQGNGGWTPPSNAEWAKLANPHLVSLCLAWLTLNKTKPELIAIVDQLGDEGLMDLVANIGRSADRFKGLHEILSGADYRIMCAYAVRVSKHDGHTDAAAAPGYPT
jgi:hypothetical protein